MEDIRTVAKRKARYGHRDWLYWKTEDCEECAEVKTEMSLNQMLRAYKKNDGKGIFQLLAGSSNGMAMLINEDMIKIMLSNIQYGIWNWAEYSS